MSQIEPFAIEIDHSVIDRIMARARDFRWPIEPDDSDWRYGAPTTFLRDVQQHWLESFVWAVEQRRLNDVSHFRASIDGRCIHFIRHSSGEPDAIPLLLVHGWPGSFVEYLDLIQPLARCEGQSFHVVVVSLPGYGVTDLPLQPMSPRAMAAQMNRLMTDILGCDQYAAHGGDWGCKIAGYDVIPPPPRSYVEKVGTLVHWAQVEQGGHFLALEQPDVLLRDLGFFARSIGKIRQPLSGPSSGRIQ